MKICDTFGGDESLSINKTTDGWIYSLTPHLLMTEDFSPVTSRDESIFVLPTWLVSLEKFSESPPGASLTEAGWEW
jgi:hypothetical protein